MVEGQKPQSPRGFGYDVQCRRKRVNQTYQGVNSMQLRRTRSAVALSLVILGAAALAFSRADTPPGDLRTAEIQTIEKLKGKWEFEKQTSDGVEKPFYYQSMAYSLT